MSPNGTILNGNGTISNGNGTISNLRRLVAIISENVDAIERLAEQEGVTYPTIDTLYDADSKAEKFTLKPEVIDVAMLATSAASQLAATLRLPGVTLLERAHGFHMSSALRIASESCAVELLREAGPKGMHAKDIGAKSNLDPTMISRSMRLLATHYIFREIEPNVFVNNRISSMIDTGKPSDVLLDILKTKLENPINAHAVNFVQGAKYIDTNGVAALVEQSTDESFKTSSYIADVFLSNDYTKTPFQTAMRFDGTMWDFFEKYPGYLQRIQMAMVSWVQLQPHQKNIIGFDWSKLPQDSLIVDVGGGNGSESYEIAKKAPHINIVVQDRDKTIQEVAMPTWNSDVDKKKLIVSGRVKLEGHDFFNAQPPHLTNKVSVYFLRFITHDWPTPDCVKILKHLHAAASPETKLLIVDSLVPYACPNPDSTIKIKGSNTRTINGSGTNMPHVPEPLLANLGEANAEVYTIDFSMAGLFNAQERTLGEFKEMTGDSGWEIEEIFQTSGSSLSHFVCVKV